MDRRPSVSRSRSSVEQLESRRLLASVAARHIFYNASSFDGFDAIADVRDDAAIAVDKSALVPGAAASFANYTGYSRGINGIMVDIAGVSAVPSADDFVFRVGNDNAAEAWAPAPAPTSVDFRSGAGLNGSDRVTITWPEGVIKNQWLQVGVKANERTGLASPDIFYFGNTIGEVGNSPTSATVDSSDVAATRNANPTNPAPITNRYDHDRSGRVNVTDESIVRRNVGLTLLNLIGTRPLPPTGLTADAFSTTRIDLDWDDVPGGVTYNVYRGTDAEFVPDASNRIAPGLTASAFSDTTVAASARHYYVVTANAPLESAASDVADEYSGFNEQPSGLTIETVDETAVELYWSDDSANELGYTVELFDGSSWVPLQNLPADSTFAYVDGLVSGTPYSFRVTADYPAGPAGTVAIQQVPPTVSGATGAVGDYHSLLLLIHGHKHKANALARDSGIVALRQRLRGQGYRILTAVEWVGGDPSVNWDGTGPLLNRAISVLRDNRGVEHVGVVGYSHGGSISRRVIQRLNNEREFSDLWNVTYSAYIDAIERGFVDHWPLVAAETRRPVFQGTATHWHDNFYNDNNLHLFNNPMKGASVPGADRNFRLPDEDHSSIDNEVAVLDPIELEIRNRVTT